MSIKVDLVLHKLSKGDNKIILEWPSVSIGQKIVGIIACFWQATLIREGS